MRGRIGRRREERGRGEENKRDSKRMKKRKNNNERQKRKKKKRKKKRKRGMKKRRERKNGKGICKRRKIRGNIHSNHRAITYQSRLKLSVITNECVSVCFVSLVCQTFRFFSKYLFSGDILMEKL